MANNNKEVSKTRPCPICGRPNHCSFWTSSYGVEYVICKKDFSETDKFSLIDGEHYTFISLTQTGESSRFELTRQREERTRIFKENKGYATQFKPIEYKDLTVKPRSNKELHKVYSYLLSLLILEDADRAYLNGDGITDALIAEQGLVSFPESDYYRYQHQDTYFSKNRSRTVLGRMLVEKFGEEQLIGVPGLYKNKKGTWTIAGLGGIIFPLRDAEGYIYRLRTRVYQQVTPDGKKRKYNNLSSFQEDEERKKSEHVIVSKLEYGCSAGNNLGYYINTTRDDCSICWITEGEKKGIVGEYYTKNPFISIPGVSSVSLLITPNKDGVRPIDYLKKLGVKIIIVALDADKITNEAVMKAQSRVCDILDDEGFFVAIAEWDITLGKGLDDLLVAGYEPDYEILD